MYLTRAVSSKLSKLYFVFLYKLVRTNPADVWWLANRITAMHKLENISVKQRSEVLDEILASSNLFIQKCVSAELGPSINIVFKFIYMFF